jgi:hypothetical protein
VPLEYEYAAESRRIVGELESLPLPDVIPVGTVFLIAYRPSLGKETTMAAGD